ncbi:MAG TPA: GYD domain-containing protein [Bryobacteraceae bacterium]|nr:GYD domain-containing protein [Bryobacteraceae bacterium]
MPKYLIQGSYTPEGLKGLVKDTASGRKAAVQVAMKSLKGRLESLHFALGADDIVLIVDAPDNVAIAALSLSVGQTGMVNLRTTPLLTVEETDQAMTLSTKYRSPGQGK